MLRIRYSTENGKIVVLTVIFLKGRGTEVAPFRKLGFTVISLHGD